MDIIIMNIKLNSDSLNYNLRVAGGYLCISNY